MLEVPNTTIFMLKMSNFLVKLQFYDITFYNIIVEPLPLAKRTDLYDKPILESLIYRMLITC